MSLITSLSFLKTQPRPLYHNTCSSIHNHQLASTRSHAALANRGGNGKTVSVKKGGTLERIARRNHTTIAALCKKNGIKRTKVLKLGQKLKV